MVCFVSAKRLKRTFSVIMRYNLFSVKFLEVTIKASADLLVSGDSNLTDIGSIENIPVYTPNQCLSLINNQTR